MAKKQTKNQPVASNEQNVELEAQDNKNIKGTEAAEQPTKPSEAEIIKADEVIRQTMVKNLEKQKIVRQNYVRVSKKDLERSGHLFAGLDGNRDVSMPHVKQLRGVVGDDKRFSQFGTVCPAKTALQLGYKLTDLDGNPITLSTPNVEKYLLILDGQHRVMACDTYDLDMDFILVECPYDLDKDVRDKNSVDMLWDSNALRKNTVVSTGTPDTLADATEKVKNILPKASTKYLEYALTGNKEATRKSELRKGNLPSYNDADGKIGEAILKATSYAFGSGNKKVKKLEYLTAIFDLKQSNSATLSGNVFTDYLTCYLASLPETQKQSYMALLDSDNYTKFSTDLKADFSTYCKKHDKDNDLPKLLSEAQKKVQGYVDTIKVEEVKLERRTGSFAELHKNAVETLKKKQEAEANMLKAQSAVEKAKAELNRMKELKKSLS